MVNKRAGGRRLIAISRYHNCLDDQYKGVPCMSPCVRCATTMATRRTGTSDPAASQRRLRTVQ